MTGQPSPREVLAQAMARHNRPAHYESELPTWRTSVDAGLAALADAGYVICREVEATNAVNYGDPEVRVGNGARAFVPVGVPDE